MVLWGPLAVGVGVVRHVLGCGLVLVSCCRLRWLCGGCLLFPCRLCLWVRVFPVPGAGVVGGAGPCNSWLRAFWAGCRRWAVSCLFWRAVGVLSPVVFGRGVVLVVLGRCVGGLCGWVDGGVWGVFWCAGVWGCGGLLVWVLGSGGWLALRGLLLAVRVRVGW